MIRTKFVSLAVLGLALAAGLTACSEDAPTDTVTPVRVEIAIEGDTITPAGHRVEVASGQPVVLVITSDAAGELHVHSDPEQDGDYSIGTTEIELDPIDRPGVVDVESHTLDTVLVQLEAH